MQFENKNRNEFKWFDSQYHEHFDQIYRLRHVTVMYYY